MSNFRYQNFGFRLFATLSLAIVCALPAWAESDSQKHGDSSHDGGHYSHDLKNHIAVFLGQTSDDHGHDAFTYGLDYERRVSDKFGFGLVLDHAAEEIDSTVAAVAVFFHPVGGLKLMLAPGAEFLDGHEEFLVRVGISYDFHVKDWTISPTYSVDFVNDEEIDVYGLAFGKSF